MNQQSDPRWTARRHGLLSAAALAAVFILLLAVLLHSRKASGDLPSHLSNSEFWSMVTGFSEPGGYFHSDNFLSNETSYQEIIPGLRRRIKPDGVYLGVGPEQNFTYIAALQPQIAFIIDIRRQNMIEHLLYKAFMEISPDRADFVSMLFARPRPANTGHDATADALFSAFASAVPNSDLFKKNLNLAIEHLASHGILLSIDDQTSMRKVYSAFFESGPDLSYTFTGNVQSLSRGMPSYSELMTATDENGKNWGYLATESQFEFVQKMEKNNLIVPLVGNFAGVKAIRTVGNYVREHRAAITLFYLSNVEQYLFQQNDEWSRFYTNVATLPIDSSSMFIRSTADRRRSDAARGRTGWPLRMLTSSIADNVQAFQDEQIHTYNDVLGRSDPAN